MKSSGFISLVLIVLAIIGGNVTSHAATYTWDVVAGDTNNITEGAGIWQVGGTNWNDAGTDTNWANGNQANFGGGSAGTAGVVTVVSDVTVSKLFFGLPSTGSYTIELGSNTINAASLGANCGASAPLIQASGGGFINLTSDGTWNLTTGGSGLTVAAKITGNSKIYYTGAGSLRLTNPTNDFTGICQKQNGGTMWLSSIKNIGVPSSAGAGNLVGVGFNGSLRYNGAGDTTDRTLRVFGSSAATLISSGSGAIVFGGPFLCNFTGDTSHNFTIRGGNASTNEIAGNITDNGTALLAINKQDSGKWILSGTNTYSGNTSVGNGTLMITGSHTGGRAYTVSASRTLGCAGAISITNGLTFNAGSTNIVTVSNILTGDYGSFTVAGGAIALNSADLVIEDAGLIGDGEILLIDNQTGSAISGTFAYSDGARILGATREWFIRYDAGDGDDVGLKSVPISTSIMIQ